MSRRKIKTKRPKSRLRGRVAMNYELYERGSGKRNLQLIAKAKRLKEEEAQAEAKRAELQRLAAEAAAKLMAENSEDADGERKD